MDELAEKIVGLFAEPPELTPESVQAGISELLREDPARLPIVEDMLQDAHRAVRTDVPAHHAAFVALLALEEMRDPAKVVGTWTELALQGVLKHPGLNSATVDAAKKLVVGALTGPDDAQYVLDYRKRVFQLYLLDAPSDTSGIDAVETAALDDAERERRRIWKENLGDILISFALQKPRQFCQSANSAFAYNPSRLELLILFRRLVTCDDFDFAAFASSDLLSSILLSLTVDNSTSVFTVGLTVIVTMLPHLAIQAHELLVKRLPTLFAILARALCSNGLQRSEGARDRGVQNDGEDSDGFTWTDSTGIQFQGKALEVRPDLHWQRLEASFVPISSRLPSADHYFTFLYGMYPCNTVEFLRRPSRYMRDHDVPCPFVVGWQEVLEDSQIRQRALTLARKHALSSSALSYDVITEVTDHRRWADMAASDIISQVTALDITRVPASSSCPAPQAPRGEDDIEPHPDDPATVTDFSNPERPRISVRNMIATTMALKSGAALEVVDYPAHWPVEVFYAAAGRPSRSASVGSRAPSLREPDAAVAEGELPARALQAVAILQRESLLLRNELNYQLWLKRGLLQNIERLQRERNVTVRGELERQHLRDKRKEYQAQVEDLQAQLKTERANLDRAQRKLTEEVELHLAKRKELRESKKKWEEDTANLRSAEKELKAVHKAQSQRLAEASTTIFELESKAKEAAPKIERLEDYEKRIEQLTTMQKAWDADVRRYRAQKEQIEIMVSNYKKMEDRLASYQAANQSLLDDRRANEQKISELERKLAAGEVARPQASSSQGSLIPSQSQQIRELAADLAQVRASNKKLRADNATLRDRAEELESIRELQEVKTAETPA
ncbi:hypothetical protein AURDEDRAFT_110965 [Auricularia subglabra TFB-10046 SS5]|nr:hypothetical protein AURDEDRAFT_110965 [Auricularia subglabra TFB-10046 SS5]